MFYFMNATKNWAQYKKTHCMIGPWIERENYQFVRNLMGRSSKDSKYNIDFWSTWQPLKTIAILCSALNDMCVTNKTEIFPILSTCVFLKSSVPLFHKDNEREIKINQLFYLFLSQL